ncbi:MAG: 4-alpha-glucanotransferase [Desulfuromonas sp.]|nr:MAG: 4-alpha-glucanotransferase [Desulfuromonas sp.]
MPRSTRRASGILLHPTSLPGDFGIGTLGRNAYRFIDQLRSAGQSVWQVLPLGPTGWGNSPYTTFSAFAGNPLMIDLPELVRVGDLTATELPATGPSHGKVDFAMATQVLDEILPMATSRFFRQGRSKRMADYECFCQKQAFWLNDYALFRAARGHFGHQPWTEWPAALCDRKHQALHQWGTTLADTIRQEKYLQFLFFEQWMQLKGYANRQGVKLFGDMPIFVAQDSSDVWCNRELFRLDPQGNPSVVAGVPPDYFSRTGQRWGNPLYDWDAMIRNNFDWWCARIAMATDMFDLVRIDHFRGFAACWEIPAAEKTAINGRWRTVPGDRLFQALQARLGKLPLVAEDLGVITEDVIALRDRWRFPGMCILQFAFDGRPDNPYLPHNFQPDSVVFTCTHDNNTTLAWWRGLKPQERRRVCHYFGKQRCDMPWDLIRLAAASVARLCIFPLQDVLALGGEARMNRPGVAGGNWDWQLESIDLPPEALQRLAELTHTFHRIETDSA